MATATLNFTNNQVYDGKLANLADYDAVKYDRTARTLTFYVSAIAKVVFENVDSSDWRRFENHFKKGKFFTHVTQWACFNDSTITNSNAQTAPYTGVSVNFDTTTIYNLSS